MRLTSLLTSAVLGLALTTGAAFAQTSTTPTTPSTSAPSTTKAPMTKSTADTSPTTMTTKAKKPKSTKAAKAAKTTKVRSEISLACSTEANTQNLHGKPRRDFRKKCMADKAKMKN